MKQLMLISCLFFPLRHWWCKVTQATIYIPTPPNSPALSYTGTFYGLIYIQQFNRKLATLSLMSLNYWLRCLQKWPSTLHFILRWQFILSMSSTWALITSPLKLSWSTIKAAIELIFPLPSAAHRNERIRSLTGVYLRQGPATERQLDVF